MIARRQLLSCRLTFLYLRLTNLINQNDPTGEPPTITGATIAGKKLMVLGENFDTGARLFMNGERQPNISNDLTSPTTLLIAKKAAKKINAAQTVILQVRNSDNTLSNEFSFTRPAE